MPSSPKIYFPNGKPPKSGRKLQSIYSNILPGSNTSLCRCIASFVRTLLQLNLKEPSNQWMESPSDSHLLTASDLPDSILVHPIDSIPSSALTKLTEKIPPLFRIIFLQDLKQSNFPGLTFAWEQSWDSRWNKLFSQFILKHWRNAHQAGTFKAFHMNPDESSNHSIQNGILHRWFLGRQKGVRLGHFSEQHRTDKKKSEKRSKIRLQVSAYPLQSTAFFSLLTSLPTLIQLQKHRQQTLSELPILPDEMELFDAIKCTSETEVTSNKTFIIQPVNWRSSEFSKTARQLDQIHINKMINLQGPQHVQAFNLEQIRKPDDTPSTNIPFKNVPQNLPINCYSSEYIGTLSALEKQILSTRPPVDFSKLLSITKGSSKCFKHKSFQQFPHQQLSTFVIFISMWWYT